ncbi:MAG: polysaccharide deacetylase family protein [Balneolaceae bacterium]|nr:polysaccharide deacetylase family protein [Balneolaceae bacterium]MCH8547421.1 polysaccharide deacetylase family protein [Balneolaceae bacterium]
MSFFTLKHSFPSFIYLFVLILLSADFYIEDERFNRNEVLEGLEDLQPEFWGMNHELIKEKIPGDQNKEIALTFDACGGDADEGLINWLKEEKIPATLFLSGIWIANHPELTVRLSDNPLFKIENHGYRHLPCSADGREAEEIEGTGSVVEIFDEIARNDRLIREITGRETHLFRSGTAHYDEVCLKIAERMGLTVAGFTVNGDGGGKLSAGEIKSNLMDAGSGDIVLLHMNRPENGTLDGLKAAVPKLREAGYRFVLLEKGD